MLSREQLEAARNCEKSNTCDECELTDTCGRSFLSEVVAQTAIELMDQVEAQQKEIEQLEKFKQDSIGLIQRHEKLKERNAVYIEALEKCKYFIKDFICKCEEGDETTPEYLCQRCYCMRAIDKAIGGGQ